ncbi:hypothetical protein E1A91_A12G100400v1 [Gossypium mustelinum]|uniref:Uncharacterized protein n=1 Tax=Gossypium mustelinum TaxID=34275 RepID=A0A5D2WSF1_GOSMU|nr:hypothetical protein E1A91_A12G100400v1 [Gossypium mustelinum]
MKFPLNNSRDFAWVNSYTIIRHNVSKKSDLLRPKFTLTELGIQFLVSQVNQYVVNKDHQKLIQIRPKIVVHQIHKYRRGISQTKGHDKELIMPISCPKCSLRYILLFHP